MYRYVSMDLDAFIRSKGSLRQDRGASWDMGKGRFDRMNGE
jgi:hypothetical protein